MFRYVIILALSLPALFINTNNYCLADVKDEINALITEKTVDLALAKADSALKADPKNVELLILKGNIIFSRFSFKQPSIMTGVNCDESVYDNSIGYVGEAEITLPVAVADSIVECFMMASGIEPKREDIYYGICYIYSLSLQTEKLLSFLPVLKAGVTSDEETPYTLGDYARNIKTRGSFDDAILIYKKIAALYPECSGIVNDIAVEYYFNGNFDKAKEYFAKALSFPKYDFETLSSAFTFYAICEENSLALNTAKKKSELLKDSDYLLYQALINLNDGSDWKTPLNGFLNSPTEDSSGVELAKFMLSSGFDASFQAYGKIKDIELKDAYKIQLYKYFMKVLKNPVPQYDYAEALTYNARYRDAVTAFKAIDTSKMSSGEKELYCFYYAWALYKSGDHEKSCGLWEKLINSSEFYYQSAAAFFIGEYYQEKGDKAKAKEYYSKVSDKATESKFATYCWNRLNDIDK